MSLVEGLYVKSSTKNSGGNILVGGLFSFLVDSSTYPDSNWTIFPPVLFINPNGPYIGWPS